MLAVPAHTELELSEVGKRLRLVVVVRHPELVRIARPMSSRRHTSGKQCQSLGRLRLEMHSEAVPGGRMAGNLSQARPDILTKDEKSWDKLKATFSP